MQLNLYSSKGTKLNKKISVDKVVFESKVNEALLTQAVYVYLANQRKGTADTKLRSEIRGGGAKPWAQKGTGRARVGSIRSPIWKGGGVTFGPSKERVYSKKLTKKMKKAAIRSAFSQHAKQKSLIVLEKVELTDKHLTKQLVELTEKLPSERKVLYIYDKDQKKLHLAARNLANVNAIPVNQINVFNLLSHDFVVILKDTLEKISEFWGEKKGSKVPAKGGSASGGKIHLTAGKHGDSKPKEIKKTSSFEDLKLPTRTQNILLKNKINTLKKLEMIAKDEKKLAKVKGLGAKSIEDIKKVLNIK